MPTSSRWSSRSSRSGGSGSAPGGGGAIPRTRCRAGSRGGGRRRRSGGGLGAGGGVRAPGRGVRAVLEVGGAAESLGWGTAGVVASPLPGPAGNVEFFLWLRRDAGAPQEDDIRRAVEEGPR